MYIFIFTLTKPNKGGARYRDAEILRTLRDYEAVDAESFCVGAMEEKAVSRRWWTVTIFTVS